MLRALRWAAAFLTILPVAPRGEPRDGELGRSTAFFPLVGAAVGLACWGVDTACASVFPNLVRGLLVVAAGVILTRGLHLDGLSDTVDGLGSLRDRDGMLEVMRDPHVGAFGAAMVALVVFIQAACVAEMPASRRGAIFVAGAAAARLVMAVACGLFRYARPEGKAGAFVGRAPAWAPVAACAFAAGAAWAAGRIPALAVAGAASAAGLLVAALVAWKLRGVTGDVLGAAGELTLTTALLLGAAAPVQDWL
jgi:adenosylcobinamide-GDP ribazoletransferase